MESIPTVIEHRNNKGRVRWQPAFKTPDGATMVVEGVGLIWTPAFPVLYRSKARALRVARRRAADYDYRQDTQFRRVTR